jgi:hypothetical protein
MTWLRILLNIAAFSIRRGIARAFSPYPVRYSLAVLAFLLLTESGRTRFLKWIDKHFGEAYLKKHPWLKKPKK